MPFVRRSQPCVTYTNRGSSNYSAYVDDPVESSAKSSRGHKYLEVVNSRMTRVSRSSLRALGKFISYIRHPWELELMHLRVAST